MANAGYTTYLDEMQHAPTTGTRREGLDQCPRARRCRVRASPTPTRRKSAGVDGGALVLVVPTVDTVAEAIQARDWAFFPPSQAQLGGGAAFAPEMWGSVPGGYRNTIMTIWSWS